jgi:hypothetical protein
MTVPKAAQLEPGAAVAGEAVAATRRGDVGVFLGAVATMMRQTVERFEDTVGRISEMVMTRSGRPDRELVVALQDFDRLQQEFAALGDVIEYFSATTGGHIAGEQFEHHGREAINAITVADLRDRMLDHLRSARLDLGVPDEGSEDVVF